MTIQQTIDTYLKKLNDERATRQRSGKWNPSQFGRCFRLQYFSRKNIQPTNPPDDRMLRVFSAGNLFHKYVQDILRQNDKEDNIGIIDIEKKVETEDTFGFADIVTTEEVVDLKSQHSKSFWYMKKEIEFLDEEKPQDILQVTWYAINLDKPFARIVYISKDDLCMNEYLIPITETRKENVSNELKKLNTFWQEEKTPPAEARCYKDKKTGKYKECEYCNWKNLCSEIEGYTNKEAV
jgi:hypothetical protein